MKIFLSALCFALAGLTYSAIPQNTMASPTYPTVVIASTQTQTVQAMIVETALPVVQAVIVEDVYQPPVIQSTNEVVSVVVVPEVLIHGVVTTPDIQTDNYDPSLYDEWKPWAEPTPGIVVNVIDLDTLWDVAPLIGIGLSPCPDPLPTPFVTWDMAQRVAMAQSDRQDFEQISIQASIVSQIMSEGGGHFPAEGNIRMPENDALYMLMASGANACQINGNIAVYGNGVQSFLDDLHNNYLERN